MGKVRFFYGDVPSISLKGKRVLQQFVSEIFFKEGKVLDHLSYIFCSDPFILDINQKFLNHDYYTDIITFDLSEGGGIVGEVYISIDTVRSNSILHHTHFNEEMLRVIFHGALHLCGFRDKKKSEKDVMRQKEEYYLQSYFKST